MRTLLALALFSLAVPAHAEVPTTMSHQGRLLDSTGVPLSGPTDVTFRIYDAEASGTLLWEEEIASLDFDNGYFQAELGQVTALDDSVFEGNTRYLAIQVGTDPELASRLAMVSVPFAVRAGQADSADALADGLDIDVNSVSVNGVTVIDSSGAIDGAALPGDTLGDLICSAGELTLFDGSDWVCAPNVHDTAHITTGTFSIDRLPMGTGTGTVASGDHTHAAPSWADITGVPSEIADGDANTQLTEGQVETFVTNGALDLAGGTTVGGEDIVTTSAGFIRFLGSAYQDAVLESVGNTWRDIPGATVDFVVPSGVSTTRFRAHGSVNVQPGPNVNSHCGFRFVVDGTGYGDGSWGDVITGCQESSNANIGSGWWCPWTAERELTLSAGAHTVQVQQTGWSSSSNSCYSDPNGYSRANLFVEAY